MKPLVGSSAFLLLICAIANASIRRVEVTKENQAQSGLDVSIQMEDVTGDFRKGFAIPIIFSMPAKQPALKDLWRTEVWIVKDGKTQLTVPVTLDHDPQSQIVGHFTVGSELVKQTVIAVRCGKHAPLSETIYQIDLPSYMAPLAQAHDLPAKEDARSLQTAWVAESLKQMETVKPGTTRTDLLKVFCEEGGLSTRLSRSYCYRGCGLFKVDVRFEAVGIHGRDQDGRVSLTECAEDVIVSISKPYLEWHIGD